MEIRNWKQARLSKGESKVNFMIILEPQMARSIWITTPEGKSLEATVPQGRKIWREYRAKGYTRG